MKKIIFALFLFLFVQLPAKKFNPLSPSIHHLFGKSTNDPLLIYYFEKLGLSFDKFEESQSQWYNYEDVEFYFNLPLDDKLISVEITMNENGNAEKAFSDLITFYKIPLIYEDFDKTAVLIDKKNSETIFSLDKVYEERYRSISYSPEGSFEKRVLAIYSLQEDGNHKLCEIVINGDFFKEPVNEWRKKADKFYKKLSNSRKEEITTLIANVKQAEAKKAIERKENWENKEKLQKEKEEQLKKEKLELKTIWDEYLANRMNLKSILYCFNYESISQKEFDDIKKKYSLSNSYDNWYELPGSLVEFGINNKHNSYYLEEIKYKLSKNQEVPFLGINQQNKRDDLVEKFGKNYYMSDLDPTYSFLASTTDLSERNMNLTFNFEIKFNETIDNIVIKKTNSYNFHYAGFINPIVSECETGDCENGKGIYQYANGIWIVGLFRDGEIHRSIPYKLSFVSRDIAGIQLLDDPDAMYIEEDTSIWSEYFIDHSKSLLHLFNKKDFTKSDWKILRENYFVKQDGRLFYFPDDKFILETDNTYSYLRSIIFTIHKVEDLKLFGFDKNLSYQELEDLHGKEYIRSESYYKAIGMPKGVTDKKNHFEIYVDFNSYNSGIKSITFKPLHPEVIQINDSIEFIKAGPVNNDDVSYQWIDGMWFKGKLARGIPYDGDIYSYEATSPIYKLTRSKISSGGYLPSIISDYKDAEAPISVLIDKAKEDLYSFNSENTLMSTYLDNIIDDKYNSNWDENWKYLSKYAQNCNNYLNSSYNYWNEVIILLEDNKECIYLTNDVRKIQEAISGLKEVVQAAKNIGLRHGNGEDEDIDTYNEISNHFKLISQSTASLIDGLSNCNYFKK